VSLFGLKHELRSRDAQTVPPVVGGIC
jgi:hypothetical protein